MTQVKNKYYVLIINVDDIEGYIKTDKEVIRGRSFGAKVIYNTNMYHPVPGFETVEFHKASIFQGLHTIQQAQKKCQQLAKKQYKKGERPRFYYKRVKLSELYHHSSYEKSTSRLKAMIT